MTPSSKTLLLSACTLAFPMISRAQVHVTDLILAAPGDAQKMAEAYMDPLFKSMGMGLSTGWNNTAKVKKTGRFDIRIGGSGVIVPAKDKTFDVTKIGLSSHVTPADPGKVLSPTVAGKDVNGPVMNVKDDDGKIIQTYTMPKGVNFPMIPVPQVQASVGLPRGIGVAVRFVPAITFNKDYGKMGMYGGGIKLDILPLLVGDKADGLLPIDIAVAANYARINYKLNLDLQPEFRSVPKDASQSTDFSDQQVDANASATTIEIILSKKVSFFTPFASLGYNHSRISADVKGSYPMISGSINDGNGTLITQYTTYTNPFKIDKSEISHVRATFGFQLNLPVFRFYADYNFSQYNCLNVGVGFGIGK